MDKPLIKQLLLSSSYWVLNKTLVKLVGLEAAFLLSCFAEAEKVLADKDGWFYQTSTTVEEITTLSRHKQDVCIKQLEDMGILEKDVRGMPAKRYFRVNYGSLTSLFVKFQQTSLSENSKLVCQKLATNKESSYKENNYKESIGTDSALNASDTDLIISEWNKLNLQQLRSINPNTNRYTSLKARLREYSLEEVIYAIRSIKDSPFLRGQNKKNWTITFDWFIKPNNFIKVLEGNYIDKVVENKNGKSSSDDGKISELAKRAGITVI